MLKMKCSNCGEFISSSLLAEMKTVACDHCRETVPVENLLISARGFTIGRDDLLKRISAIRSFSVKWSGRGNCWS